VLWLGTRADDVEYRTYLAYFYESVSGLNPNATVSYRGVRVGHVRRIALDPKNPERVEILLDIEQGTPVKNDTAAIIQTQGLTGIAHVELTGGSANSPDLEPGPNQPYPIIQTKPSLLVRLDTAVSTLLAKLTDMAGHITTVTERLVRLLDDDQQARIADTLEHVERITGALALRADDLGASMHALRDIMNNASKASEKLPAVMDRATASLTELQHTIGAISKTTTKLDGLIGGTQKELGRFTKDALPQVGSLLVEVRELSASLTRLTRELEKNPDAFLFGRPNSPPGPGE
jgi:phospholipid/cholesterol/gamma-HCH transport system substrate-binding protein